MPGVLLPNGGSLYGEWTQDPGICGATGTGVLLPNTGRLYGASPCPEPPPTPPIAELLLEHEGLWLYSSVDPDTWTTAVPWENQGTAGPTLDLLAAINDTDSAAIDSTGAGAYPANAVNPVAGDYGFDCGFALGNADDGGADYSFYNISSTAWDMSGSYSVTFDFAPYATAVTSMRYLRKIFMGVGNPGWLFEDATYAGGWVAYAGAGANPGEYTADTATPTPGRQTYTYVVDRVTNIARAYLNGSAVTLEASALAGVGDMTNNAALIVGPGQQVYNIAFITRALTASEAESMPMLLAAT